jgi:1-acyl-sn-glycerol-3-phosphate acyltransferase
MNLAYRIAYVVLRPLSALLYPQSQTGRENVPAGPCVVCANHSSNVDPVLVAFALGWRHFVHFLAKIELFRIPLFGWFLRRMQAVSIDRGKNDVNSVRVSMKYLKRGEKLLIFPEGTRVSEDDAVAAKSGAVRMAAKLGVPLLPVYVPRKKRLFRKVKIHIGKPYNVNNLQNADYQALASELMEEIHRLGPSDG